MLEYDHPVGEAVQLQITLRRGLVVEKQHGARASDEELLERQDLSAEPQRLPRQEAHLGQRIEDDSSWIQLLHYLEHRVHRLLKLNFCWMKNCVALFDLLT